MLNLRGLPLYLPVLLATGLAILPASYLIFGSLWSADPGQPGQLTSQNFAAVVSDPTLGAVILNSVAYAFGAALFAAALALVKTRGKESEWEWQEAAKGNHRS